MKRFRFFSLFFVFVTLSASTAFGGMGLTSSSDYALLFATDTYMHRHDLYTPIADAQAIGEELENRYGFKVDIRKNVTIKQILAALAEYKQNQYRPGDQLLVYFTGHGYFDDVLNDGHVAGTESESPETDKNLGTYISFKKLRADLDAFPCTNIMLILDVCYGGTFDDERILKAAPPLDNPKETIVVNTVLDPDKKKRWYLNSTGKGESAGGGIEHTPFALALLQILRGSDEVLVDDVLTIPEIERQLPSKLESELDKLRSLYGADAIDEQIPASGPFGSGEATDKAFVLKASTETEGQTSNLKEVVEEAKKENSFKISQNVNSIFAKDDQKRLEELQRLKAETEAEHQHLERLQSLKVEIIEALNQLEELLRLKIELTKTIKGPTGPTR